MTDMPSSETLTSGPARWKLWLGYFLIAVAGLRIVAALILTARAPNAFHAGKIVGQEMAVWIIALPLAWFLAKKVPDRNKWPRPLIYGAALWLVASIMQLGGSV